MHRSTRLAGGKGDSLPPESAHKRGKNCTGRLPQREKEEEGEVNQTGFLRGENKRGADGVKGGPTGVPPWRLKEDGGKWVSRCTHR